MDNTTIIIILVALAVVCVGIFYFLKNSGDDVKKIDPESVERSKKPIQPLRSNNAKTAQLESLRTKVAQTTKPPSVPAAGTKRPDIVEPNAKPNSTVPSAAKESKPVVVERNIEASGIGSTDGESKSVLMPAPVATKEEPSQGFINIVSKGNDLGKDVSGRLDAQFAPARTKEDQQQEGGAIERPTQAVIPTAPLRSPSDKQKPSILLVDDSKVIRVKTEKLLSSAGYQVTLAIDGIDALSKLETLHPDVIITDIEMPNLDGFGLVRSVKNNLQTSEIPVIVMTSHVNLHLDIAATEGINGFLPKPFTDKELFEQVSYLVGS